MSDYTDIIDYYAALAAQHEGKCVYHPKIESQSTAVNTCADCGKQIGQDKGPPDGWQLEDGRTVCHQCCVEDFKKLISVLTSSDF